MLYVLVSGVENTNKNLFLGHHGRVDFLKDRLSCILCVRLCLVISAGVIMCEQRHARGMSARPFFPERHFGSPL